MEGLNNLPQIIVVVTGRADPKLASDTKPGPVNYITADHCCKWETRWKAGNEGMAVESQWQSGLLVVYIFWLTSPELLLSYFKTVGRCL